LQSPAHDAGIVQGSEKKSAFASSVAPAIMIAVVRSGNNYLYQYIVTPDHGERPAPATRLSSNRLHLPGGRKAPTRLVHHIFDAKPVPVWLVPRHVTFSP